MKRSKLVVALVVLLISQSLRAQDRFMVFFTDKANNDYSLSQPEAFLSQRSLDRRAKNNVVITEEDLPVSQQYVDQLTDTGVDVYYTTKWMNGALVQMNATDTASIILLDFVDRVEFIAPNTKLSRSKVPVVIPENFTDPSSVTDNTERQLELIGVDQMHLDGYTGKGVFIAVFDAGFLGVNEYTPFQHIFDNNQLLLSRDFVKNSGNVFQYHDHGSASFFTIAAKYGPDISGTAPDADFMLCVTEDVSSELRIEEYNWLLAAELADSAGVDVINTSLGYTHDFTTGYEYMEYTNEDLDGETSVIARAANMASSKGIAVVVSAGNYGTDSWKYVTTPADSKEVLAVGSVNSNEERSSFSSFGPTADGRIKPDIMAMGRFTTVFRYSNQTGTISLGSGTSFAAPQVAGLAAGLLEANPSWTRKELINAIKYTGTNALNPGNEMGYGLANYAEAIKGVVLSASDILNDRVTVFPNPFSNNRIYIAFDGQKFRQDLEISVIDTQGRAIFADFLVSANLPDQLEINFNTIEKGIYFLILKSRKLEKRVKLIKL